MPAPRPAKRDIPSATVCVKPLLPILAQRRRIPPARRGLPMSASQSPAADSTRLFSLDAYRGAIMLLMVTAGLGIPQVAKSFTHSPAWQFLAHQTDHEVWSGCALWD